ncbi:hypothetical protein BB559_001248 [Furculomyces boomerangus]|uniref:type I protein arginine methyltransferase n=1 Tax=Furculomyces boomerangus TaxID=61424 RepID=A0A2T9Z2M6_9FUNG|nr:hypothetical protein BB559_002639 [Furculomyces boomerangus]PVU98794.1 hypothetical protein BB559_001248 [Furculomyces boomerangus]
MEIDNIKNSENKEKSEDTNKDVGYFQYYSHLQHQQNMLQDFVRTSTYRNAITELKEYSIENKTVMDVGSGSGILSYFAVKNGASKVYAIEASTMASKMQIILDAAKGPLKKNEYLADKIQIIKGKIEDITEDIPKVDTIISEPIGVLLVHERMLESYIYAREKYLKPEGTMAPSLGTICLAPITDGGLWAETMNKARFWQQNDYYGVDLSPLSNEAYHEYFTSPVVGCFNPLSIMTDDYSISRYDVDFYKVKLADMQDIRIPLNWEIKYTGIIHAVGGWFDCEFGLPDHRNHEIKPVVDQYGKVQTYNSIPVKLSTSPRSPATHWQQVRFLLPEPLAVNSGQVVSGEFRMVTNNNRSYDITMAISLYQPVNHGVTNQRSGDIDSSSLISTKTCKWFLHEQVYNYSFSGEYSNTRPENLNLYLPEKHMAEDQSEYCE